MEIFSLVGKITLEGKAAVENALKEIDAKAEALSGRLEKVGSAFSAAGKKMTDVGKSISLKVTTPIAAIGAIAVKTGMDFEAAMSEVAAISGAAGEDLAKLEALAKEMGATTKFSASEAAEGLKYMAMAGWDTQQMLAGLPGVLSLAAASGEDLGRVSDIVTDALTAFGMQASEAAQFADILAAASSNANTNVGMLGESFKYVAPVFGSLGYSAEDAALALGLMANAGIKASQAGTALRGAITRMMKPSNDAAKLIEELGLKFTDAEGNMLPFRDVMDQLRSAFANLTAEQQAQYAATIFGQEAMSGMLAIINASEEDYNKLAEAIDNSTGAAEQMAKQMQDNLKGRLTELKSAIEGVALQLYDAMLPALEWVVEVVQKLVAWFSSLDPKWQQVIVTAIGFTAALGPLLLIIGKIITVVGTITSALPILGAAFTALTGPVGLVVAAIAAAIAIGVELYKNWDVVKDRLSQIWGSIKQTASDVWNGIWNTIKGVINWIIGGINKMINALNSIRIKVPAINIPLVGKVGGFEIGLPRIPTIPELAAGGIIQRSGLALVGEAGPELLELPQGAKVKPLTGESIDYDRLEAIAYASFYDAFVDAMKTLGKGEIRINIDGRTLAREMIPRIIAENQRLGVVTT